MHRPGRLRNHGLSIISTRGGGQHKGQFITWSVLVVGAKAFRCEDPFHAGALGQGPRQPAAKNAHPRQGETHTHTHTHTHTKVVFFFFFILHPPPICMAPSPSPCPTSAPLELHGALKRCAEGRLLRRRAREEGPLFLFDRVCVCVWSHEMKPRHHSHYYCRPPTHPHTHNPPPRRSSPVPWRPHCGQRRRRGGAPCRAPAPASPVATARPGLRGRGRVLVTGLRFKCTQLVVNHRVRARVRACCMHACIQSGAVPTFTHPPTHPPTTATAHLLHLNPHTHTPPHTINQVRAFGGTAHPYPSTHLPTHPPTIVTAPSPPSQTPPPTHPHPTPTTHQHALGARSVPRAPARRPCPGRARFATTARGCPG